MSSSKYGTTRKNTHRYYTTKRLIRYIYQDKFCSFSAQVNPPGHTTLNTHLIKKLKQHCYCLQIRKLSTITPHQQLQQREEIMLTILPGVFTIRVQLSGSSTKRYLLRSNEKFLNFCAITPPSLTKPSYVPWTQMFKLLLTC